MFPNRKRTVLALLLTLVVVSGLAAFAASQPPVPLNKVRYFCSGGNWEWVEFAHPTAGNIRHGTSRIKERGKKADTKKSTLAYDPSRGDFWEYTLSHGGGQCQKVVTRYGGRLVTFDNCSTLPAQYCAR